MMNREHQTLSAIVLGTIEKYETPCMEIHEVSVERGFAGSVLDPIMDPPTW